MTNTDDLKGLRALTRELQAMRFTTALRLVADEVKYESTQPRLPKGVHGGGRWAGGSPGAAGPKKPDKLLGSDLAAQLGRAAMANPEAAATAGVATLPMAAGAVGLSRAAGLYDHYTTGDAITPILGLDGGKLETGPAPLTLGGGKTGTSLQRYEQECDDQ